MMLPNGGRSSLTSAGYYEKLKYFTWLANDHPRIACLMRHRPTRLHVPERHFWGHLLLHRLFIDRVLLLPTPPPKRSNRRRHRTFTTTRTPQRQRIRTCKPRQRNVPSQKADSQSPRVSSTVRTALHRSHRSHRSQYL